jgi:hypothetical protein
MSPHDTKNPNGGVNVRHVMELPVPNDDLHLFKSYRLLFITPDYHRDRSCEFRSLAGTRTRVEDPDLSGVVWGGGVKVSPSPDWTRYFVPCKYASLSISGSFSIA